MIFSFFRPKSKGLSVTLATLVLSACALNPAQDTADEISEMWAFAYQHRTTDVEDTRLVRYADNPADECQKLGLVPMTAPAGSTYVTIACTNLSGRVYSILPRNPDAMTLAHEAAHRRYGDWHKGYAYFTAREWQWINARKP